MPWVLPRGEPREECDRGRAAGLGRAPQFACLCPRPSRTLLLSEPPGRGLASPGAPSRQQAFLILPRADLVCYSTVLWHSRRTLLNTWLPKHRNIVYEPKTDDAYPPPCMTTSCPTNTLRPHTSHPNLRLQRPPLISCSPADYPLVGVATAHHRGAQWTAKGGVTSGGGGTSRESGLQGQEKRPISGTEKEAGEVEEGGGRGQRLARRPTAGVAGGGEDGHEGCGRE